LALEAWNFYARNANSPFVREFGLMPSRIEGLGLEGNAREVFEDMLDLLHRAATGQDFEAEE